MMGVIMADQAAGVRGMVVRDWNRAVRGNDFDIEVHQSLAGNVARLCAHPVGGMADRARESVLLNVAGMFAEAGVIHDLIEVVALGAQSIGAAACPALRA